MPPRLKPIARPHLFLVEGTEEEQFWEALLRVRGRDDVQVQAVGGKYSLTDTLPALTGVRGFDQVRWLGVSQDADDDPEATLDRICTSLRLAGLAVPRRSWELTAGRPAIVAFVLPDGASPGDLEALVWDSVANELAIPCVETYFSCLTQVGLPMPRQLHKAKVHAYLASLDPPDRRLGDSAADGLLLLHSPVFDRILNLFPTIPIGGLT